eukprot:13406654-Alexandrium_andersonii.AAC.1
MPFRPSRPTPPLPTMPQQPERPRCRCGREPAQAIGPPVCTVCALVDIIAADCQVVPVEGTDLQALVSLLWAVVHLLEAVSYTHLTLPTICSV